MKYSDCELFYSFEKNLSQEGLHHMLCLPGSAQQCAEQLFEEFNELWQLVFKLMPEIPALSSTAGFETELCD